MGTNERRLARLERGSGEGGVVIWAAGQQDTAEAERAAFLRARAEATASRQILGVVIYPSLDGIYPEETYA